jgi:hypothetical protein
MAEAVMNMQAIFRSLLTGDILLQAIPHQMTGMFQEIMAGRIIGW